MRVSLWPTRQDSEPFRRGTRRGKFLPIHFSPVLFPETFTHVSYPSQKQHGTPTTRVGVPCWPTRQDSEPFRRGTRRGKFLPIHFSPVLFPETFTHVSYPSQKQHGTPTTRVGVPCWPTRQDSEPFRRGTRRGKFLPALCFPILFPETFTHVSYPLQKQHGTPTLAVGVPCWPTRQDSNLRPRESESRALSSWATGRNCREHL